LSFDFLLVLHWVTFFHLCIYLIFSSQVFFLPMYTTYVYYGFDVVPYVFLSFLSSSFFFFFFCFFLFSFFFFFFFFVFFFFLIKSSYYDNDA